MALTRDDLLLRTSLRCELVSIPEMGDGIYVRQVTAGERDRFERAMQKRKGRNLRAHLVALVACDADRNRLFKDSDVNALADVPASVLEPIINAHLRMNASTPTELVSIAEADGEEED